MRTSIRSLLPSCLAALGAAADATAAALPGDIQIIATGAVNVLVPSPMVGPMAGLVVGDTCTLTLDVRNAPVPNPSGTVLYPLDLPGCSLRIGNLTFAAHPGSASLGVEVSEGAVDMLQGGFAVQASPSFHAACGLYDPSGTTFSTTDLMQLAGTYSASSGVIAPTLLGGAFLGFIVSVDIQQIQIVTPGGGCAPIGTRYCSATPNSSGSAASISACGSASAAQNDVRLTADNLPANAIGYFLCSRTSGFVARPGASQGNLCLSGAIGRFDQSLNVAQGGQFSRQLALHSIPQPTHSRAVLAGETWYFQAWFTDTVGGIPSSNFTDGVAIAFS